MVPILKKCLTSIYTENYHTIKDMHDPENYKYTGSIEEIEIN